MSISISLARRITVFFQFVLIMLVITSCANAYGYTRYNPNGTSPFTIQFDYPDNWRLIPDPSIFDHSVNLIFDPQSHPPTAWPKTKSDQTPERGYMRLEFFKDSDPKGLMEKFSNGFLGQISNSENDPLEASNSQNPRYTAIYDLSLIENTTTYIDGYPARILAMKYSWNWEGKKLTIIWKSVHIATEDRLYMFDLRVQEKDQSGTFAREFDKMIASIKLIR